MLLCIFLVNRRRIYRCDDGQGASPGKQQAKVDSQKPPVQHHHQPHPLQQPVELQLPDSSTAQVRLKADLQLTIE